LDRSFSPTEYKSLQLLQIHLVFPWDLEALLVHFYRELLADLVKSKNRSFISTCAHAHWVCPCDSIVYKGVKADDVDSYRPISILFGTPGSLDKSDVKIGAS
jgi:hypothetical protein